MSSIGRRNFTRVTVGGSVFAALSAIGPARAQQSPGTQTPAAPAIVRAGTSDKTYHLARDAYLYAYPIVSMDVTMRQATNVPDAHTVNMRAPFNQFAHARAYPSADERDVVRYNFDTLYSFAWLDLAAEPIVVTAPNTRGRYYLLPMLDMWTDVFATIGTRTVGNGGGDYAVVAPGWEGKLPSGVGRIVAPTPNVWILGRTQTNGPSDYENVHRVQDGYRLTPLSQWDRAYEPPTGQRVDPAVDDKTPPLFQVNRLEGVTMLSRLAELMRKQKPHPNDYPMLFRLRAFGIEPGRPFDPAQLDSAARETINRASKEALADLVPAFQRVVRLVNGWFMQIDTIGTYGTSYLRRAIVATGGLGANLPEDAVYPATSIDGDGQPLSGEHRYVIRFEPGRLPPADAFWSLTMYDADGFQVPNRLNRFALGDRDRLTFGSDGSLEIYAQADSPGAERESNWLPAPKGLFQPTMRLYSPRAEVLDGRWAPPPFKRVS